MGNVETVQRSSRGPIKETFGSYKFMKNKQEIEMTDMKARTIVGLVQKIFTLYINYLAPEVLVRIFNFLPFLFIARSAVRVCRLWKSICYAHLKPHKLHMNFPDVFLYKTALRNFNINSLVVHRNLSVKEIIYLLSFSKRRVESLVACGMNQCITSFTQHERNALANVKTLAIRSDQVPMLEYFPNITRLQLVSTINTLNDTYNYPSVEELAIDRDNLLQHQNSILAMFPSLKKIHVMNDLTESARIPSNELNERGIHLFWTLNVTEDNVAAIPYHHYYYQTGDTLAVSNLPLLLENYPVMSSSLEYEMDLYSRPLEYIYPSGIDFSRTHYPVPKTEKDIVAKIQVQVIGRDVDILAQMELLPYWKIIELALPRSDDGLLLQMLDKFAAQHIASVRPRVLCRLIEHFGIRKLIDIIGEDQFEQLVNARNLCGTSLVHKLVQDICRIDLNEIEPYIHSWHIVNNKGIAPIDVALKSPDLSVIMFLLHHNVPLEDTKNIPFHYKYLNIFKKCLPQDFLARHISEMLFHEDWLKGVSAIKALDEMVSLGANVNAVSNQRQSFLNFLVSYYGNNPQKLAVGQLIRSLVTRYLIDINHVDDNGDTPLGTAIKTGCMKVIRLVIHMGANVSLVCSNNLKPIPFICRSFNNINEFKCLLDCLLEYGADMNATSTPLLLVMEKRNPMPFVKHLIDRGASLNYVDHHGNTLIHHMLLRMKNCVGYNEIVQLLREKLMSISTPTDGKGSAIDPLDLRQITPQLSEEILTTIFKAVEA